MSLYNFDLCCSVISCINLICFEKLFNSFHLFCVYISCFVNTDIIILLYSIFALNVTVILFCSFLMKLVLMKFFRRERWAWVALSSFRVLKLSSCLWSVHKCGHALSGISWLSSPTLRLSELFSLLIVPDLLCGLCF